jgi:Kef-type K+ transport system membrane component KefB
MSLSLLVQDPLTRFITQAVTIVVASRLLGLLARRIGQPQVVAEITAGILLGPSLLGVIAPDAFDLLFARESLGVLQLVSQLGLLLFMFVIGLELDPNLLKGRSASSVAISSTSIVAPFGLGAALAYWLYPGVSGPGVSLFTFALFLGIAMSITAFPVLARILRERRLFATRVGAIALACAAVDDVTAWCLLAFVVAAARVEGVAGAVVSIAAAFGYVVLMLGLVRPLLARLAARVRWRGGPSQDLVAGVLLLLLLSSLATELIGIHFLFGAFLFGVILPRQDGLAATLAHKLEDLVSVLLLPLFFAYSGMRTQIGLLDGVESWLICAVAMLIACVGKFGGAALAARLTGMSWREAGALGVLMNTRGLMELVVLNIGLDLGVIGGRVFTIMVIVALLTTFMTTPALALIYPASALASEARPAAAGLEPALPFAEAPHAGHSMLANSPASRGQPV